MSNQYDVIIIGAGGAGLMCAMQAGGRGRRVLIIDHNEEVGKKILISGGGRCNFTNVQANPDCYVSNNPHFAKSALSRYTPEDFIKLVEKHRIDYHEKKLGQLFCDGSARQIVDLLLEECKRASVHFLLNTKVHKVEHELGEKERAAGFQGFRIVTSRGDFHCRSLVIASGGLSIPQIGASGFGYEIAKQFSLKLVQTAPALDGFDWGDGDLRHFTALAGVSIDSTINCGKVAFRENILFTHKGLSGPAALQASLYWQQGKELDIDLLPEMSARDFLMDRKHEGVRQEVKNVLGEILPKRFAEYFTEYKKLHGPLYQVPDKKLAELGDSLNSWRALPARTVGYRKAEVTRGGVDTGELSSSTMEAKKVPGLYFIGEVVDVTGWLGGYNFQWAWASGFAAGNAV